MELFGADRADVVLSTHGMPALGDVVRDVKGNRRYPLPFDSGRRMALARWVLGVCGPPVLLWIGEFGVWPSSENVYAFDSVRFRKHGGSDAHQ